MANSAMKLDETSDYSPKSMLQKMETTFGAKIKGGSYDAGTNQMKFNGGVYGNKFSGLIDFSSPERRVVIMNPHGDGNPEIYSGKSATENLNTALKAIVKGEPGSWGTNSDIPLISEKK